MLSRWIRRLIVFAGVLLLLAAAALGFAVHTFRQPYRGWSGESTTVRVEPGTSATRLLSQLGEAGVLERPQWVRAYLKWRGDADSLQAGEYRFEQEATPYEVLQRLRDGDVVLYPVTIPEGWNRYEVLETLLAAEIADRASLESAFDQTAPIAALDAEADTLEGYLFPDTYHFEGGADGERVATTMVRRFLDVVGEDYAARAKKVGLTVRQAVTLASMIEKETSVPDERTLISAVFHNRIEQRMLMQCDPTVMYALEREGQPVAKLYSKHLRFDSPYNTYRYPGLPPGPIANPGRESLEAAVAPIDSPVLYFVAKPGGGHTFSESLTEHNRAVRVWSAYERSSSSP